MGSPNEYRDIAQDCLRMAVIAEDDRDRPLWVTMAQSWIQLAEHVARLNLANEHEHGADGNDTIEDGDGGHLADGTHSDDADEDDEDAGWSRPAN
jgi:hypothetical protein